MRSSLARPLVGASLAVSLLLATGCVDDGDDPAVSASPSASTSASTPTSPSASSSPSTKPVTPSTDLSEVKVTGNFGQEPKVEVPAPWAIDQTKSKVVQPGGGQQISEGQAVKVDYYGVNGRTGKKFDDSFSRGEPAVFNLAQVVPGFGKGLVGQEKGSRVVIAMPGADGYDQSGGNPQIGVEVGDTLIFVVDVIDLPLTGPQGEPVEPDSGLPTVTEQDGELRIEIPKTDPPTELQVQPLVKGAGAEVTAESTVTFDYRWVRWADGGLLEESYTASPVELPVAQMFAGMQQALTGQKVGSRILFVVPPKEAYPQGNAEPKIEPDDTLVMVVDVLFAQ